MAGGVSLRRHHDAATAPSGYLGVRLGPEVVLEVPVGPSRGRIVLHPGTSSERTAEVSVDSTDRARTAGAARHGVLVLRPRVRRGAAGPARRPPRGGRVSGLREVSQPA